IQASNDRLLFTLEMAKLGSWQYDPRRRVLTGDTRFKEIFDVNTDEMPIEDLKKLVHPDDAERFWADHEASIDLTDPMRSPSHEYRVQRRNGEVRWVEVRWFAYGDRRERGSASVVGVVHDITQRKSAEAVQARLAAIVTSSADAIVGKTLDGIVTSWNEAAERMFGYSADEIIGQSIQRVIPSDSQAEENTILSRMAQSESIE